MKQQNTNLLAILIAVVFSEKIYLEYENGGSQKKLVYKLIEKLKRAAAGNDYPLILAFSWWFL